MKSISYYLHFGNDVTLFFSILRLIFDMDNIFALIIIIYFLWSLLTIGGTLLMVQMELVEFYNRFFIHKNEILIRQHLIPILGTIC